MIKTLKSEGRWDRIKLREGEGYEWLTYNHTKRLLIIFQLQVRGTLWERCSLDCCKAGWTWNYSTQRGILRR